jgi:kynureninase
MLNKELDKWMEKGVRGHFEDEYPWFKIESFLVEKMSNVLGCKKEECAIMNSLTTNLHLLMVAFYKPTKDKFKIVIESNPFPSDMMAVISQVRYHGFDPEEAIIQICPRENEVLIRTEDFEELVQEHGDSIALIMIGTTQFLTGNYYETYRKDNRLILMK